MSHNKSPNHDARKRKPSYPIGTWKVPGPPPAYVEARAKGVLIHVKTSEK